MTLNEYQKYAQQTDGGHPVDYYLHGLASEVGEVAGVRKRELRGDDDPGNMKAELGDVLWYLTQTAEKYGLTLDEVAQYNIEKLRKRAMSGTIRGKGDNR